MEIRRITAFLQDKEEDFVKLLMSKSLQEAEKESKRRERELRDMLARCRELDELFTKTYEDNTNGKLTDERFMMITKRFDDKQLSLKKKISALQAEIQIDDKLQFVIENEGRLSPRRRHTEKGFPGVNP